MFRAASGGVGEQIGVQEKEQITWGFVMCKLVLGRREEYLPIRVWGLGLGFRVRPV